MMQLAEFTTTLKVVNGVGYLKEILNPILTLYLTSSFSIRLKDSP